MEPIKNIQNGPNTAYILLRNNGDLISVHLWNRLYTFIPKHFMQNLKHPLVTKRTIYGKTLGRLVDSWVAFGDRATIFQQHCKYHQALYIISSPYVNSNWSYSSETAKLGLDLCDLDFWPLTLTFCMDIMSVNGNNSWTFQDDTMTGTVSRRCDGRTDGQTERSVLRAAWSQLKIGHFF